MLFWIINNDYPSKQCAAVIRNLSLIITDVQTGPWGIVVSGLFSESFLSLSFLLFSPQAGKWQRKYWVLVCNYWFYLNKQILTEGFVIISCVLLPINNLIHTVTCWKKNQYQFKPDSVSWVLGIQRKKYIFSNLHDLNPHVPQDSLQWNDMNSGLSLQTPALDHSAHFS